MDDAVTGQPTQPSPWARLRATWLLLTVLIGTGVGIGIMTMALRGAGRPKPDARFTALVAYLAALLAMLAVAHVARLDWRRLLGGPVRAPMLPLAAVVVPVGLLTVALATIVYVPLSYVAPGFVQHTLLDADGLTNVSSPGQWLLLVLVAVVAAPVVEEVLFRGLLMHRWAHKWGTITGVVASSILFAIGHQEWLGHFLFGAALCVLYLRTRTLWMPILAHAANNAAAAVSTLPEAFLHQVPKPETLADLRGQAWLIVPLLLAGIVTGWLYLRRFFPDGVQPVLRGGVPYFLNGVNALKGVNGEW